MRAPRRPALLLSGALALGGGLSVASPAYAAGSFVTPDPGAVYQGGSVGFTVRLERFSSAAQLAAVDPTGRRFAVADLPATRTEAQEQTRSLDTACPAGCSAPRARNGTWTAELTGNGTDARTTFVLAVPPVPPADDEIGLEALGPRQVAVTWRLGREPDLVRYDVVAGDGAVLATRAADCPDGLCRSVVTYDADGPSTDALAVRAVRSCPSCDGDVLAATSVTKTVARPGVAATQDGPSSGGAPAGDPAGDDSAGEGTGGTGTGGTTGGSGGGSTGGTTGGGTGGTGGSGAPGGSGTTAGGTKGGATPGSGASGSPTLAGPAVGTALPPDDFALTFQAFGPKIGLPKLPPLPATGVAAPAVAPLADGTFAPQLPFDEQVVQERVPTATASGPVGRVTSAVGAAVDSERLVRGAAGALVLFLVVAHVRRFLAQTPEA